MEDMFCTEILSHVVAVIIHRIGKLFISSIEFKSTCPDFAEGIQLFPT